MGDNVRIENSKRNTIYGFLCQVVMILLTFMNRQVFITFLGKEYLGINGLFSNILSVLSLAEMGIGNAFLFFLYKPIRDHDYEKLQALLRFCKKLFYYVAFCVFIIGMAIIPLLSVIVDVDMQIHQIRLYYFLYLINSVLSYFAVNKSMIIEAYQKNYITSLYKTANIVLQNLGQIAILLLFHNYILYLLIQVSCTILYNIIITHKAYKMYPCIFQEKNKKLEKNDKKSIWAIIRSTFVYRVGVILMNNTDNILISIIITTVTVGYYSNYKMVETVIGNFISVLIRAITASLGDLNAENNSEHSLRTFRMLVFVFHVIVAFCSICLLLCINDFIYIWIGETYLLDLNVVAAMIFCFYISNIITPVWVYRETMGLYRETKYLMLIAACINLLLSIILGKIIGLSGIIVATGLARVLTTVWYEPRILFKKKFKKSVSTYYCMQIRYVMQTLVCFTVVYFGTKCISASFAGIMCKIFVTGVVVLAVFVLFNRKTAEYIHAKEIVKELIRGSF